MMPVERETIAGTAFTDPVALATAARMLRAAYDRRNASAVSTGTAGPSAPGDALPSTDAACLAGGSDAAGN